MPFPPPGLTELITGALGGGGILKAADWLNNRAKTKAYTMGAIDHAVETAMGSVTGQLERTDARLMNIEAEHRQCRDDLAAVQSRLDASERDRAELRAKIDELMAEEIARYPGQGAP